MADSDDEYDRKRRDKFQGERSESYRNSDRRKDEEQWSSRARVRTDYRDRYSQQYQSDVPPNKRMRYDMEDRRMRYMEPSYSGGYSSWADQSTSYVPNNSRSSDMETQPPIMTFKAFLQTQDDNITDEEAISKYAEYKLEFRRQQLNEFFVAHKEEEWFKVKYHPEESMKKKDEHLSSLKKRASIYMEMLESGRVDTVKVDADHGDAVVKLLDAVVIRCEGGTDLDLTILDLPTEGPSTSGETSKDDSSKKSSKTKDKDAPSTSKTKDDSDSGTPPRSVTQEESPAPKPAEDAPPPAKEPEEPPPLTGGKKRRRTSKGSADEEESGEEEDDDDEEDKAAEDPESSKEEPPEPTAETDEEPQKSRESSEKGSPRPGSPSKEETKMEVIEDEEHPPGVDAGYDSEKEEPKEEADSAKQNDSSSLKSKSPSPPRSPKSVSEEPEKRKEETTVEKEDSEKDSKDDEVVPLTPRPLHRTSSIFLRTISPRITKAEIETICKRYPGFLRVSLADPQPEQHWFRRGWVTFRRDVNVKEICWNLNNIRVRDCELGAIVNRDLSRRVRTVSGLSAVKQVVLHDIKLCAKLIQDLDARAQLWQPENETSNQGFGLISANPILKGITDFLVDEASAEEEELLGQEAVAEDSTQKHNAALKVLDRLLLYLRIVHSVDFYNQSHYPNEDEMPNRCGIMHLRGTPSSTEVSAQEISEYTEAFRTKLTTLLAAPTVIDESELTSLGAKSQETEVEKFILANTQELAKDKWLCPLSGKKFKGPEFVRKHIFNKFANELEEVKKEVDYFNNYLRDPKRPQLAEHPGNRSGKKDPFSDPQSFAPSGSAGYRFGYGGYRGRGGGGFGHYGGYGGRGSRGGPPGYSRGRGLDYRPVVTYRDLDAPCEPEEII